MVKVYRTLYHPVQEFILRHQVAKDHFHLEFDVSIIAVGLEEVVPISALCNYTSLVETISPEFAYYLSCRHSHFLSRELWLCTVRDDRRHCRNQDCLNFVNVTGVLH